VAPPKTSAAGAPGYKNRSFGARLGFALHGLAHALRAERSLRAQLAALIAVVVALLILRPPPLWWALALLASASVLAAELLNTAIEYLADELHPGESPGMRRVKDCAAAGVLLAVLGALAVAAAFLWQLLSH
jgi:undecaprenol kinase